MSRALAEDEVVARSPSAGLQVDKIDFVFPLALVVLQPERGGVFAGAQCRQIGEAPQRDHDREAAERSVSDLKKPIRFVLPLVFGAKVHSLVREAEPAGEFLGEFADMVPTLREARLALHREAGTDDALLQQFIEDGGKTEFSPWPRRM